MHGKISPSSLNAEKQQDVVVYLTHPVKASACDMLSKTDYSLVTDLKQTVHVTRLADAHYFYTSKTTAHNISTEDNNIMRLEHVDEPHWNKKTNHINSIYISTIGDEQIDKGEMPFLRSEMKWCTIDFCSSISADSSTH